MLKTHRLFFSYSHKRRTPLPLEEAHKSRKMLTKPFTQSPNKNKSQLENKQSHLMNQKTLFNQTELALVASLFKNIKIFANISGDWNLWDYFRLSVREFA